MNFNIKLPELEPQRLAVKLTAKGERSVRSGHPWVFSDSIVKGAKDGAAGDLAIIFGSKTNEVMGIGLYDPVSPIRIKILHSGGAMQINAEFFQHKIKTAFEQRKPLLESKTNSYRLLFGENDGFPGFIADVYADVLVVKLYSEIWYPFLSEILSSLIEVSNVNSVVLRLSRKLAGDSKYGLTNGLVLYGELKDENIHFVEHGVKFSTNVIHGHKTGYFLDHRHNRKRVGELSEGKKVLDVFSYAGGFSIHALAGGATEVTSVDISKQALEVARYNAELNEFPGTHYTIAGDAFVIMKELIDKQEKFDLVVIDPPSFAKSAKEIEGARKKYWQLATLGAQLTAKKGRLVLASCSSRITAEDFISINEKALQESGRPFKLADSTFHDIDHPISFHEGAYLKTGYYEF